MRPNKKKYLMHQELINTKGEVIIIVGWEWTGTGWLYDYVLKKNFKTVKESKLEDML